MALLIQATNRWLKALKARSGFSKIISLFSNAPYALAFWLYLSAIRLMPVSIAAQFLSLIPVFGVGGAYLFLGERLTVAQGIGINITIAAVSQTSRLQSSHE